MSSQPISPYPLVGTEFAGYRVEAQLGRGGMSVVYLANDTRLQRNVALKVLAPELADDGSFRERFLRESLLAASIDHPNIVPIYDAGNEGGVLYIAMRYVAGCDVRALIDRGGAMDPALALSLVEQAGRALDAAHERGLVHRDVKPANMLVTEQSGSKGFGHLYLADFGLTKQAASSRHLTATGQFLGTLDYVSPEQVEGRSVDHRADIYALGCVLYECLTGQPPFPGETSTAVLAGHLNRLPPPPSAVRPGLPDAVDAVVLRALAKSPADRPASCEELTTDARAALQQRPVASRDTVTGAGPAAPGVVATPFSDSPPPAPPYAASAAPSSPPYAASAAPSSPPYAAAPPQAPAHASSTPQAASNQPPQPPPPPSPPPPSSPSRRRSTLLVLGVVGVVLLLGVTAIIVLGSNGGSDPPEPPLADGFPDAAEAELLSHIPSSFRSTCERDEDPPAEEFGAEAAVVCFPASIDRAFYSSWASRRDLTDAHAGVIADAGVSSGSGDCADDVTAEHRYAIDGEPAGRVACWRDSDNGLAWITWTHEDLLIYGEGLNPENADLTLYRWWAEEAGPN